MGVPSGIHWSRSKKLNELNPKQTERGLVITLGDVLFDTNQAQLKSGGVREVQKLAEALKQNQQRTVFIEGFTDSTGTESRNQELSEQRAITVIISDETGSIRSR